MSRVAAARELFGRKNVISAGDDRVVLRRPIVDGEVFSLKENRFVSRHGDIELAPDGEPPARGRIFAESPPLNFRSIAPSRLYAFRAYKANDEQYDVVVYDVMTGYTGVVFWGVHRADNTIVRIKVHGVNQLTPVTYCRDRSLVDVVLNMRFRDKTDHPDLFLGNGLPANAATLRACLARLNEFVREEEL